MTTFEFYPPAEQEYLDAARHFDEQGEGLGDCFVRDVEAAILKIRENPLTWRKISRHARRYLANNFPYQVIYAVDGQHVYILAVVHLRRNPAHWKSRIREWRKSRRQH